MFVLIEKAIFRVPTVESMSQIPKWPELPRHFASVFVEVATAEKRLHVVEHFHHEIVAGEGVDVDELLPFGVVLSAT